MNKTTCLFPECKKIINSRGLCTTHYRSARELIKKGKITWEELEKMGKSKATSKIRPTTSPVTKWFLGEQP